MPGLGVTNPLIPKMMIGTELFCMSQNVHFYPPPHQLTGTIRWRAVTLWLGTAALDTLGGLDYSKECRRRTNNNGNMHAQMLRVWSGAERNGPQTACVDSSGCPASCASCTISVEGRQQVCRQSYLKGRKSGFIQF